MWVSIGMPDQLTFVIQPNDEFSSFDLLVKSLEDIKRVLRHVDYAMYGRISRRQQEWAVHSIRSSAPTITLVPRREDRRAVGIVAEGLRILTEGTDQPPPHFTEPVLEGVKGMSRLFRGRSCARALNVLVDDEHVASIGQDIAEQTDRVLSAGHRNLGSLQGRLEAINVHNSPTATIWDGVSDAPVRWTFPRADTDGIKSLLEKLVLVTGDIRYFSNGMPRSISNVTAFEEVSAVQYSEKAGFGSIPDGEVQAIGAVQWLMSVRRTAQ